MRDSPGYVLTRHFLASLFDFGFLSDEGTASLKRALLGSLAVALALGLLLVRIFMKKYAALAGGPAGDYAAELLADHAFLMAVPMWFVAGGVALVSHSLFPDHTDFRILMAEPLSRLTIFASKLASLLLFVGLIVAGTHLALLPLAGLTLMGTLKTGSTLPAATAFLFSSLSASVFAALASVSAQGLLVLFAPRARLLQFSGAVRSLLIGLLVLSVPLVAELPATASAFASGARWLPWAPPAWFVGLERWLMGDGRHAMLAAEAATATVLALIVSVASYVLLYRRFDQVMLQPAASRRRGDRDRTMGWWVGRLPVRQAVRRFVSVTIRRSALHQGLIVGLLAAAGGFVLNSLVNATGWNEPLVTAGRSPFLLTILWAPPAMMCLAIPATRVALSVPLDVRSNWIFRMTEDVPGRAEVASAGIRIVLTFGVGLPLALLGPVQWWVLGRPAAGILALEALIGWLAVEWVMAGWSRIPFTCSYLPGKGFVPHMFVKGFASYLFFTTAATLLLRASFARTDVMIAVALIVAAAAGAFSVRRARSAPDTSLMFDDELPRDVNPLTLSSD